MSLLRKLAKVVTAPLALSSDAPVPLRGTPTGDLGTTAQPSPPFRAPTTVANGAVVTATPAGLWTFDGTNLSGAVRWFMWFDALAIPPNGATPVFPPLILGAGGSRSEHFVGVPIVFYVGLVWALSTTGTTLTLDAGPNALVSLTYTL